MINHQSLLQTGTTDPGTSPRIGVTSDEAENAPRLRVTYGEDSKESNPNCAPSLSGGGVRRCREVVVVIVEPPFAPANASSLAGSCPDYPFSHSRAHPDTASPANDASLPFPIPTPLLATPQPEATSATKAFTPDKTRHHAPRYGHVSEK